MLPSGEALGPPSGEALGWRLIASGQALIGTEDIDVMAIIAIFYKPKDSGTRFKPPLSQTTVRQLLNHLNATFAGHLG
jgi:hypothetical protein